MGKSLSNCDSIAHCLLVNSEIVHLKNSPIPYKHMIITLVKIVFPMNSQSPWYRQLEKKAESHMSTKNNYTFKQGLIDIHINFLYT